LPSVSFKLAQRLPLGNGNVSSKKNTAHLSDNCSYALHTALKVLINTNYTNIFDGNGYLAIYSSL
jgi:hypothetical protein